uniref:Endonuclease/exonuclease/phosphatase domain-containing protein n=1 Tax=Pygocentrus nattereri TaxID=42514 RepID=A0AAR2JK72_PYGNA
VILNWVGQVYFSSFTSNKRGTAILIHKNLPFIFKKQIIDCEGQEFSLLNIYAPNEDCPKFMPDKITLFSQYTSDFGIIAGDFNCCMGSNLDKSSMLISSPNASRTLSVTSREAGLVDVWREFNPTSEGYTFYSARHKTYSRLDFFLLPKNRLSSVVSLV